MSTQASLLSDKNDDSTLCGLCQNLERLFFCPPKPLREAHVLSSDDERFSNHYASFGDLIESVARGCRLCGLINTSLQQAFAKKYPDRLIEVAEFNKEMFRQDVEYLEDLALVSGRKSCRPGQFIVRQMQDWYLIEDETIQETYVRGFAGMSIAREWQTLTDMLTANAFLMFDTQNSKPEFLPREDRSKSSNKAQFSDSADCALSEGCIFGRAVSQNPNWELAKSWVLRCRESHNCSTNLGFEEMPARLVFIDAIKPRMSVRLIDVDVHHLFDYVCLSYRWPYRMTCKTTRANVLNFYTRINESMLPSLFRDAIIATRNLGYRHLWIDALCIIQDKETDFEMECPRMGSIFARAALTLAAPDVEGCDQGFLQHRHLSDQTCTMAYRDTQGAIQGRVKVWCLFQDSYVPLHKRSARESPLDDRCWIMQERMLSPRLLYFSRQQMYFECHTYHYFEALHFAPIMHDDFVQKFKKYDFATSGGEDLYSWWYKMLNDYSERKLTYQEDKLPAVSGIASIFQKITGDSYVAGIWRGDIARGLAWFNHLSHRRADPSLEHSVDPYTAPSWSWAKSDCGSVVPMQQFDADLRFELRLEILDIAVQVKGRDPFGRVAGGTLKVEGLIKKGCLFYNNDSNEYSHALIYSEDTSCEVPWLAVDLDEAELESTLPAYSENVQENATEDRVEALSMLLSCGTNQDGKRKQMYALILQTTSTDLKSDDCLKVKRIGLAQEEKYTPYSEISPIKAWFEGCDKLIVEIL